MKRMVTVILAAILIAFFVIGVDHLFWSGQKTKDVSLRSWDGYAGIVENYWVGMFREKYSDNQERVRFHIRNFDENSAAIDIVVIFENGKCVYYRHLEEGKEVDKPEEALRLIKKSIEEIYNQEHRFDGRDFPRPRNGSFYIP